MERAFTTVGDVRIHSVHGGAGPPVVLLHGLAGSSRWWRYTLPVLAREFRVHVPELVGFGATRPGPRRAGIAEMTAAVRDWMDELRIERPHLIGHSMGGQIALHLCAAEPERVRRLVLAAATGIPRPLALTEAARFLAGALPPRAWGTPAFHFTVAADALRAGPRTLLRAATDLLTDDVRPLLPRVTNQTLLVWGALDPLIPVEHGQAMAEALPDARLVVLADAAHNAMADRPLEFNRVVLDFLEAPER
ncbi:MAG: alpha/beta hydrolase [Gemmatimonadota bacterium]